MLLLLSSLPAEWCYRLAMSGRQARSPGEPLPLYGLPLDVECLRITGGSQHSVQTSREPKSGRMVTSESAEAGVVHYRGAGRLDVLTFAPAESMTADYLLFREPGSRQRGPMPRMAGGPVAAAVLVGGVSVGFAGYEVPGLVVASYESLELEDVRIVLRGAQIGLAEDPVVSHRGQP